MKKLLLLSMIFINTLVFGQKIENNNYSIEAKFGTTVPIEGDYLKTLWRSGPYIGLDLIKEFNPIKFVVGLDYENLYFGNDKIKFISPHLGILHSFKIDKFFLTPSLKAGYTFINYTSGKGLISTVPVDVQEYKQSGFSTALNLKLSYTMNDKINIGIGSSYLHIFESFGATEPKPDDSTFIGLSRPYISVLFKL